MAEEEKRVSLVNEGLKVMVTGAEPATGKVPVLTDNTGKKYKAVPLSVNDMIEFEERNGISLIEGASQMLKAKHLIMICFLSARKDGLTRQEIIKKEFRVSYEEFCESFDFQFFDLTKGGALYALHVLEISGVKLKKKPVIIENPKRLDKSAGIPEKEETKT